MNFLNQISNYLLSAGEDSSLFASCGVGDRIRTPLNFPFLWIIPQPCIIQPAGMGNISEQWTIKYLLICLTQSSNPETGQTQAIDLLLEFTEKYILNDRTLGGLVYDLDRTEFSPSQELPLGEGVFASGIIVEIRKVYQPEEV